MTSEIRRILFFSTIDSIDVLINNAGKLVNKAFLDINRADLEECYNVNVMGVIETVSSSFTKNVDISYRQH